MVWSSIYYFDSFFAPLVHALHPTHLPAKKTKLKLIECYFTLIRIGYPHVRELLTRKLGECDPQNKNALANLQLLLDIPLVILVLFFFFLFLMLL